MPMEFRPSWALRPCKYRAMLENAMGEVPSCPCQDFTRGCDIPTPRNMLQPTHLSSKANMIKDKFL